MSHPDLQVIEGGGDIVAFLEKFLEQARDGQLDGIVICTTHGDGSCGWGWSGMMQAPALWARLVAVTGTAHVTLLQEGL